jgi:hypothetical protein
MEAVGITLLELTMQIGDYLGGLTPNTAIFNDFNTLSEIDATQYAYFGIEKYIREVVPYFNEDTGDPIETYPDTDTTFALCKMDAGGRIYQRALGLGGTFVASICMGGISNNPTPDLTIMTNNGASSLLMYPFFETYGASTDISSDIIGYSNTDNRRISLELGNRK